MSCELIHFARGFSLKGNINLTRSMNKQLLFCSMSVNLQKCLFQQRHPIPPGERRCCLFFFYRLPPLPPTPHSEVFDPLHWPQLFSSPTVHVSVLMVDSQTGDLALQLPKRWPLGHIGAQQQTTEDVSDREQGGGEKKKRAAFWQASLLDILPEIIADFLSRHTMQLCESAHCDVTRKTAGGATPTPMRI